MKKGFTLAEVLITLGVIGVIAALTIPGIIVETRKHEIEVRFKKFYSEFNQAIKLAEAKNGEIESWGNPYPYKNDDFYNFLIPQLVGKYCKVPADKSCPELADYFVNVNSNGYSISTTNPAFITADGFIIFGITSLGISGGAVPGMWRNLEVKSIYVDMNGFKKPNKTNLDIFTFQFLYGEMMQNVEYALQYEFKIKNSKLGLYPSGAGWEDDSLFNYTCRADRKTKSTCPQVIVSNGFKFPKNYNVKW